MNAMIYSFQQKALPNFGLLALGVSLSAYISCQMGMFDQSTCSAAIILLVAGAIQILAGLHSQQQGRSHEAAALLPFGIFWLSIIGYQIFPKLGFGQHPTAIAMFSYLSLWALFVAILFMGSFRQSLATQYLYGTMMVCLLALSADQIRDDRIFLAIGCVFGLFAAFVAIYTFAAQFSEDFLGRAILPLGKNMM